MPSYVNDPDALVTAAGVGDYEVVEQLIEKGVDPDLKCEYGDTAIISAVRSGLVGTETIIEYLLDHGADIDEEDINGDTALDLAKYHGYDSTITFLKSRGATGPDGPSAIQRMEDEFYAQEPRYLDDRMFVLEISRVTTRSMTSTNERQQWAVIERRNVFGYPPTRCKEFDRRDAAVAFLKELAPQTPRVSLDGESPSPLPSWDEFQSWLTSLGVARLQVDDSWGGPSSGARRSFEFFESGHSIDQVVETTGRDKSTVNAYLRAYLAHATVEDPSPWVDAETKARVEQALDDVDGDRLKSVVTQRPFDAPILAEARACEPWWILERDAVNLF